MFKLVVHAYNLFRHITKDVGVSAKRSSAWPKLEKEFLSSNPTCAICNSKTRLNVHHKKPFHLHPELELDPNNLITLCMSTRECHLLIGHGDNFKAYNPNVEKDVATLHKDISRFDEVATQAKANRLLT